VRSHHTRQTTSHSPHPRKWTPQSLTAPSTCYLYSVAKAKTQVAQTSTQQTSAKSSSTCNSSTPKTSAMCPIRTDTPGAVAFVKDKAAGRAESTVPTRRCGTTYVPITGFGSWTSSRLRTGFWLGGRAVGSAGAAAGDFHRG
jgi:hypothetical protein